MSTDSNDRRFREIEQMPFGKFHLSVMGKWWNEVEMKNILHALSLSGDEMILDAGCADGRLMKRINVLYPNCKIFGIDFALRPLLEIKDESKLRVVCADVTKIPFKEEVFDAVASIQVLFMIPIYEQRMLALREFNRVLRHSGQLIITVANYYTSWVEIEGKKEGMLKSTPNLFAYLYEPWELKRDLQEVGFLDIEVMGINNIPRKYLSILGPLGLFLDLFITRFLKRLSFKKASYLLAKCKKE